MRYVQPESAAFRVISGERTEHGVKAESVPAGTGLYFTNRFSFEGGTLTELPRFEDADVEAEWNEHRFDRSELLGKQTSFMPDRLLVRVSIIFFTAICTAALLFVQAILVLRYAAEALRTIYS